MKKKIIRITTVPQSMGLLKGQLGFMSDYFEVIGISSSGNNKLNQAGEREGISVIPVEMTRKITPWQDLEATWQLYRIFKREKPFIVHTHTPKAGTLGMIAAYLAKVPNRLHTIAGLPLLEAKGKKRWLLDTVEKITYKCATIIYPNSFGLRDIIIENKYTHSKKLKVIGNGSSNGIDTSYFNPELYSETDKQNLRTSLGINSNDFVFLFVGRLVRDKGINELVDAFNEINKKYNATKLLLVGPYEKDLDPLDPSTEITIKTHPNIISVGWQDDVRPYFTISNVLTFPSYREGFPNVVMQAGAMGLKSIVTDINGCNEIIKDGTNGIIISPKDVNDLINAMREIVSADSKNDSLKNRKTIQDRYERRIVWNAILNEYRALK